MVVFRERNGVIYVFWREVLTKVVCGLCGYKIFGIRYLCGNLQFFHAVLEYLVVEVDQSLVRAHDDLFDAVPVIKKVG